MHATHFQLYSNCLLVKGYSRSLIMDLQRNTSELIPHSMYEVLQLLNTSCSIADVYLKYGEENTETITEYLEYIREKEFGHFCDAFDVKHLPALDTSYQPPEKINNAIIEVNRDNLHSFENYLLQLEEVRCKYLVVFFTEIMTPADMLRIMEQTGKTSLVSVELIVHYTCEGFPEMLKELDHSGNKLISLTIHNCPEKVTETLPVPLNYTLVCLEKIITGFGHCGVVNSKNFGTNQQKVMESLNHNSCLYKKIAIHTNGDIKNCPAMNLVLGNSATTTVKAVIETPEATALWDIRKDDIAVCKDCEFRHICTDCRAFTEDPEDRYSKPLKCGYDPYTAEWTDWSTNPLKQQAIEYYGLPV